tara:strand:- start:217 stop:609 length:393 start_codon:yes stop_codon:yes gene_type:complete
MSLNDPLSNALSKILNAEKAGKKNCVIKPVSNTIKKVLDIMNTLGYVGGYEEINDVKGNYIKLSLLGNVNKCGSIKPNYAVKSENLVKYEKRYLLSQGFGFIIISTNQGLMTQEEAKSKNIGGKLIAYCY